jgi:prevent-host-death family protein
MVMTKKTVAAGAFKQGCLALLDEVATGRVEVIVTKRGRPVARVLPVVDPHRQEDETLAHLRSLSGPDVGTDEDLVAPTSRLGRWALVPERQRP